MADSKDKHGIIDYCISQSNENMAASDLLIQNKKYNSAANRIYYCMHYLVMAAAIKNDNHLSRPNDLLEWFQNTLVKPNIIPYDFYITIKNALKDRDMVDYETMVSFTEEDMKRKYKDMLAFVETLKQYLTEDSSNLVHDALNFIRKAVYWKDDPQVPEDVRNILTKYHRFFSYRLFLTSKKSKEVLDEYTKNIRDKKLEGNLEVRIEDAVNENAGNAAELKSLIKELKTFKIGEPLIDVKTSQVENQQSDSEGVVTSGEIIDHSIVNQEVTLDMDSHFEMDSLEDSVDNDAHDLIIVTWDFTEVSDYALQHAVNFAKVSGSAIKLLHIVKKESEVPAANEKLKAVVAKCKADKGIEPGIIVKPGNIFTDITEVVNEQRAALVVMGTHGLKGMQKLTGSYAVKVISETKAPFIVVQKPPKHQTITKAVLPVFPRKDTKKLLNQVSYLTQYFKIHFYVIKPEDCPTQKIKQMVTNNFVYVKSYLSQNGKDFEVVTHGDLGKLPDNIEKFANEKDADMIMVLISQGTTTGEEAKIIANPFGIPVICTNPAKVRSFFIGAAGA